MEEAYDAAVGQCGGLDAAKPKAVFEAMQATGEFPDLTLQARAGCRTAALLADRGAAECTLRLCSSAMGPAGSRPVRRAQRSEQLPCASLVRPLC